MSDFLLENKLADLRYERKYSFSLPDEFLLMPQIDLLGFKKSYPERQVNSLYFDTSEYDFYRQSIDGVFDRKKVRIRWYGELVQKKYQAQLEVKYKQGELGGKKIEILDDFVLKENLERNLCKRFLNLEPTLITVYQRYYFEHFLKPVRLTVDIGLKTNGTEHDFGVLEIKYSEDFKDTKFIAEVANTLPLQLSQFSKYTLGVGG
jgi:SPX domain protein involved in polyphosphate accumulation